MAVAEQGIRTPVVVLWRTIRHLYPVYLTIVDCFDLPRPPYPSLSDIDMDNANCVLQVANWIEQIDRVTEPHHLRSVLQEIGIASSELSLQIWLKHFLLKPTKSAADRDKIDFLLAHYLRLNLPPSLQEGRVSRAAIAAVLEPVIGADSAATAASPNELDELIAIAERCQTLADIEKSGLIARGRELKLRAAENYFAPASLLAFTHFNAVVRRECQRLMNSDLKFIGDALERLEKLGVEHVDCTAANWSDREPVAELKNKWATWELQTGDYSRDFFATLIGFRSAIDTALAASVELSLGFVRAELRAIRAALTELHRELYQIPNRLASIGGSRRDDPGPAEPAKESENPVPTAVAAVPDQVGLGDPLATPCESPTSVPPQIGAATDASAVVTADANTDRSTSEAVAATESPKPVLPDLTAAVARMQKMLSGKRPSAMSIAMAGTRVLLTGAEVAMFSDTENGSARTVQRAVMARIFVIAALEAFNKHHDKTKLATIAAIARTEQEALREVVAKCKASKLVREEEILSATGKQLAAMLERADRFAR